MSAAAVDSEQHLLAGAMEELTVSIDSGRAQGFRRTT